MQGKDERAEPIRQSVHIECPIEDAFRLFTDAFADWWPLASYSVAGTEAETCALEPWAGGRVFERTWSGEEYDWGSVTHWDPPKRLSFTWDPCVGGSDTQRVDVEFEADADGTRVTLTHTSWEAAGVAVCRVQSGDGLMWTALLTQFFAEFATEQMLLAA